MLITLLGHVVRGQQRRVTTPGGGLILPVDAHPTFFHTYDGQLDPTAHADVRLDVQHGTRPTAIAIHKDSQKTVIPSQKAVPTFNDTKTWWFNDDGDGATGSHVGSLPARAGTASTSRRPGRRSSIVGGWNHDQFLIVRVGVAK